jgi:hypothetical protein
MSMLIFLAAPDRRDAQDGREMLQCNDNPVSPAGIAT